MVGDMTNATNRRLAAIARGQLGIVSRQQANAAGIGPAQLRSRNSSGFLERAGANAYRLAGASTDALALLWALLIDIGGDVWPSGRTSAALLGFDGYRLRPPFDVTVPRGRHVQRVGHLIHTTIDLPLIDRTTVAGITCMSGARTLIDLARSSTVEELTVAFDCGLRDGRFSEDLAHRRIVSLRSSGRYGIPRLLEAIDGIDVRRGGHSWLEREFLCLVAAAGLPRPLTQVVLARAKDRIVRVDVTFPGTNVVVEVLGYRYHRSKEVMRRDADRMNALIAAGLQPYQFTYDHVVGEPDHVITVLTQALRPAA
jgi:hypothetical protein